MKFQRLVVCMLAICTLLLLPVNALAQMEDDWGCEALGNPRSTSTQRGGHYFTASGVVRALVVFVQFIGDTTDSNSTTWQPGQAPVFMNDVLDQNLNQQSANGGFSHWLREMSFSQMQMYGDVYFVITDQTKDWYLSNNKDYGDVNKDVLIKLDNTTNINFANYDNWTFGNNYNHDNQPDGKVDWIIMIHREDLEDEMHPGHGIAALGGHIPGSTSGSSFKVENNTITIKRNWPGSGCSMERGELYGLDTPAYAHELGHLLFDAGHGQYHKDPFGVYNQAYWGLLIGRADMLNAYDRERLGWIDFNEVTAAEETIIVTDHVTTGDAYRIEIPNTDEAFLIENHQEISYFDQPSKNGSAKGLYILHVKGTGNFPRHDIECAEGGFDWTNPFWIPNPWGTNTIPVFEKGLQNRDGWDALDALPTTQGIWHKNYVEYIDGDTVLNRRVLGSDLDPFKEGYNQVFSPWSNPKSCQWDGTTETDITVEILDENNGVYTVKVWANGNGEEAAPSKPQNLAATADYLGDEVDLHWEANTEPDMINEGKYKIYRKEVWPNGWSAGWELAATIDAYIGSTPVTSWEDMATVFYDGPNWVHYYMTALDNTQKESTPSNEAKINARIPRLAVDEEPLVREYRLFQNYPNPFNPTTTLAFALPEETHVRLTIYDLNRRLVEFDHSFIDIATHM